MRLRLIPLGLSGLLLASCAGEVRPWQEGYGPGAALTLPKAQKSLLPVVKVADAVGWSPGQTPIPAPDLKVAAFATSLSHPRWLHVLPNGDVLVAESNAPPKKEQGGLRGWFMKMVMKKAGAGVPSANRISLLRDVDGDGVAETRSVFLSGLFSPFGMALVGTDFYVANADGIVRYPYVEGATAITGPGVKLTDLPGGPLNHHWTKNIIASPDGGKLYATVGSNSNVAEKGMAAEEGRAAIWEIDRLTGAKRLFATGIRNPNGLAWNPVTGALWTAVNERDELGNGLVPDYITSVRDGGFYGWPNSYFGRNIDSRPKETRQDLVDRAIVPDYATGSHTATMSIAFGPGALPAAYASGAFVGQHGSWNRSAFNGYKVVFIPFNGGAAVGPPREVLTGFLNGGQARGRPVGVAFDARGALLVADDVGDVIWRVTAG